MSVPSNLVDESAVGKLNRISNLPSPSALNASVPVWIELAPVPDANVNDRAAGLRLGSRLKYHLLTNSPAVKRDFSISSAPPLTSVKVAVNHGGGPAGIWPPLNSVSRLNVKACRGAAGNMKPNAAAVINTRSKDHFFSGFIFTCLVFFVPNRLRHRSRQIPRGKLPNYRLATGVERISRGRDPVNLIGPFMRLIDELPLTQALSAIR